MSIYIGLPTIIDTHTKNERKPENVCNREHPIAHIFATIVPIPSQ
jgi:hypothetical protein